MPLVRLAMLAAIAAAMALAIHTVPARADKMPPTPRPYVILPTLPSARPVPDMGRETREEIMDRRLREWKFKNEGTKGGIVRHHKPPPSAQAIENEFVRDLGF
jgi:hypothetical protein